MPPAGARAARPRFTGCSRPRRRRRSSPVPTSTGCAARWSIRRAGRRRARRPWPRPSRRPAAGDRPATTPPPRASRPLPGRRGRPLDADRVEDRLQLATVGGRRGLADLGEEDLAPAVHLDDVDARGGVPEEHEVLVGGPAVPDLEADAREPAPRHPHVLGDLEVDPGRRIATERGAHRCADSGTAQLLAQRGDKVVDAGPDRARGLVIRGAGVVEDLGDDDRVEPDLVRRVPGPLVDVPVLHAPSLSERDGEVGDRPRGTPHPVGSGLDRHGLLSVTRVPLRDRPGGLRGSARGSRGGVAGPARAALAPGEAGHQQQHGVRRQHRGSPCARARRPRHPCLASQTSRPAIWGCRSRTRPSSAEISSTRSGTRSATRAPSGDHRIAASSYTVEEG